MTETNSKIRALFLAGLMVLSVFAATIALSGTAAAAHGDTNRGGVTFPASDPGSSGNVGPGATLFQGENRVDGITGVDHEQYRHASESDPLDISVPEDQRTGVYEHDTEDDIIVREPEVSDNDFEIWNQNDQDVRGGAVPDNGQDLRVRASYNFWQATDLQIRVYDETDLDITDEAISGADQRGASNSNEIVTWTIDTDNLDPGEYTVELRGESTDLRHGAASRSDTFTIDPEESVGISLDESSVTKGERVRYDVQGASDGDYHLVHVSGGDVADDPGAVAGAVFRDVGTVFDAGVTSDGNPGAIVEIDGGSGVGQLATRHLDTGSVTVTVNDNLGGSFDPSTDGIGDVDTGGNVTAGQVELSVDEGSVTLENPTDFYVPGARTTVNGTASSGISDISLYVRDEGQYRRVNISGDRSIAVSGGEFEEENVQLGQNPSNAGASEGNGILNLPGTYRLAVVGNPTTTADADTLTPSEVTTNVSQQLTLEVTDAELEASVSIVNGQIADGDPVTVSGVAPGATGTGVSVLFFGPRGKVAPSQAISVDSDGTFEEELSHVGQTNPAFGLLPGGNEEISQGQVVMAVSTPGRDNDLGDGRYSGAGDIDAQKTQFAVNVLSPINQGSLTQQQAIERVQEVSDGAGSDDQSATFQFRLTDARTSIDQITDENGVSGEVQVGNELILNGTTNRQPDITAVTAEVISGPSNEEFDVASVEEWGTDGQWNLTLNTTGAQPGTYTIEAGDDRSSDVAEFELVEQVEPETPTPGEETETETETATETETETETATETETDGDTGPGFGVVVALIALLAAALLAVRRNN